MTITGSALHLVIPSNNPKKGKPVVYQEPVFLRFKYVCENIGQIACTADKHFDFFLLQ
jgi:hypothetical protein